MSHDPVGLLLDAISDTLPKDARELRILKSRIASETSSSLVRNDALLTRYRLEVSQGLRESNAQIESILMLNKIRSQSGIATVTVVTEPYACPGRCVYCPTEERAPKSYLTNEPAVRRALRNNYDPYRQVESRLRALDETGHPTDKIELIIKGGTWSFYPHYYQDMFIRRCLEATNEFKRYGYKENEVLESAHANEPMTLELAQQINETSPSRIIGITIETRPDYIDEAECIRLRKLGVTRVELGVQTLEDSILETIVRDHGTDAVISATKLLKDSAFKIAYHLMPNLPGATPESDLESTKRLFAESEFQPDTLKIYPNVVIKSAELYDWWKDGRYQPYDDETLVELLIKMKQSIPPYVRIERVIRDIPSNSIQAGCLLTNLREEVQRRMRNRNLNCLCIRCRQVRDVSSGNYHLIRRDYPASGGTEVFLSFEEPNDGKLASLLRLRIPSISSIEKPHWMPGLQGASLIRELHTYGQHLPLSKHRDGAAQHLGLGFKLMQEAERISREDFDIQRIAVIAGIGVRAYYRKQGYELHETYMLKSLI